MKCVDALILGNVVLLASNHRVFVQKSSVDVVWGGHCWGWGFPIGQMAGGS